MISILKKKKKKKKKTLVEHRVGTPILISKAFHTFQIFLSRANAPVKFSVKEPSVKIDSNKSRFFLYL